MANLTQAEIKTLRKILSLGGNVVLAQGRIRGSVVNKATVRRLAARGIVECWRPRLQPWFVPGPVRADITVTALGCRALYAADMATTLVGGAV